ncbi:usp family [Trichoderma arundinaceum]|uniref:Usp family n=1 Tax=Trichoderma arundinaceum TaxID=490622 RepID=A0A395N7A6_TRIAR|nr:usp family [Trichoderma arundinaceum]
MANNNNKLRPMSIDAMLDMERQEVLALLERNNEIASSSARRSDSPYARSPVRSMLDIAEEEAPGTSSSSNRPTIATQGPVRSMLDVDAPPSPQLVRSMLDISSPVPDSPRRPGRSSTPSSPLIPNDPTFRQQSSVTFAPHPRSRSDAGMKRAELGRGSRNDPISNYQFSSILSHGSGSQSSVKWSSSRNSKRESGGSLGDALRGPEALQLPADRGRSPFGRTRLFNNQSKSPQTRRWGSRSQSPATFSTTQLPPGKAMLKDGQVVNLNNAYRKLSDANLIQSSGSLAQLPMRKKSGEAGEGRLVKDYVGPDGEQLDSSDEEEEESSDDEDRGRKKSPRSLIHDAGPEKGQAAASGSQPGGRQALSLLAAAEQERSQVASQQPAYQYRSLFEEPEIKVTTATGETTKASKANRGVHPATSYDQGPPSRTPSVMDSDEEADMDDIKRAQKLSFTMTNILETPEAHRAIRIIYRGDYNRIVQAAEEENHRLRKYLVATDLSDESTHALEWAIGTVLRDGDTLVAIYCIDEETGIVTGEGSLVPDDSKAMKEQAAAINLMTNTKMVPAQVNLVSEFKRNSAFYLRGSDSNAGTPSGSPAPLYRGDRYKAEQERNRAVQEITDKVLRLLRKTRLQVRVIVEVLHCKNPRHLVTEVIDLVNPTLVVIGSRGRSALKGVILGSFSNYLVTKSSVPVMVARKKLRKQSKYKRTPVKQVNNISNPTARSLANAKID